MNAQVEPLRFVDDLEHALRDAMSLRGASRVLLLSGPSRRFVGQALATLGSRDSSTTVEVFDGAHVHVPREVLASATTRLKDFAPDLVIALGGGAAVGLGKALRLEHQFDFVALPTTFAGSECTSIYGIREGQDKKTGRDPRVKPDAVYYVSEFVRAMPLQLAVQSLLNAMAHPVSALSTGSLDEPEAKEAMHAVAEVLYALEQLVEARGAGASASLSQRAASRAAQVLERGTLGVHHRVAHRLGGRFDLPHGALHSVLLPHSAQAWLHSADGTLVKAFDEAVRVPDFSGLLFDLLTRAGAETSLSALGVTSEGTQHALSDMDDATQAWARGAWHGGRPSRRVRSEDWGQPQPVLCAGPPMAEAAQVVIAVHGRGASAAQMVTRVQTLLGDTRHTTIVAPQGPENRWYTASYKAELEALGDELVEAVATFEAALARVLEQVPANRVFVVGFSQGACLVAECLARNPRTLGGLIALSGARVGPPGTQAKVEGNFADMPALFGISRDDAWVSHVDVQATAQAFQDASARVTYLEEPGKAHRISARQRFAARAMVLGEAAGGMGGLSGFGNTHSSEALPFALPTLQNTPRRAPYGLYPEQINATGFTAPRHHNQRAWVYRIRPSAQHTPFEPLAHDRVGEAFADRAPEINLCGFAPMPVPEARHDFVDGLVTLGGAGRAALRRGFALYEYTANESMEERCFYSADGELLLVPQTGAITLQTELGVLCAAPGHIVTIPRGIRFSVLLHGRFARGFVAEVFGQGFQLPERGPIGANGLADARHFLAPEAYFEDRLAPGYRVTAKLGGRLHEATQDYAPYDVVAWHGTCAPHVYDLNHFSPVANARFDHGDPSIYTVLSAPLDEPGAHCLDFVFFPTRWDVTEHTFRPPFFHRNAVTEFNGIIKDPHGDTAPFYAGGYFLTPSMTPHGIRARAVEHHLAADDVQANKPTRLGGNAMWFQFESALPMSLSPWTAESPQRMQDWPHMWGAYRSHFEVE